MGESSELLPGEMDEVLAGLGADLKDPDRIYRERIAAIDQELSELDHRLRFASETHEQSWIRSEITRLKIGKTDLITQHKPQEGE